MIYYGPDGNPIDAVAAGLLFGNDLARRVAHTTLTTDKGRIEVSTVFLVIDHGHMMGGPPILWETMVFGGPSDQDMDRYASLAAAEAGHVAMVSLVRAELDLEGTAVLAEETFDRSCRS